MAFILNKRTDNRNKNLTQRREEGEKAGKEKHFKKVALCVFPGFSLRLCVGLLTSACTILV